MAAAWRSVGVSVAEDSAAQRFVVDGGGGRWPVADAELNVRAAGTAMRFLTAALCIGRGRYRIDGTARMRQRPIQDLLDALANSARTCAASRITAARRC